ncbi:Hypothetical Protein FCC1311_083262 [Hondaea fermentalgiana]|uniref:Uncharacterized protein n=1 Tax=Hondaea fermentalgiana TaxID=2315210 RepID=A0A2R5GUP6_9STRA|nr:Hypothetical Protein FCC1311_083262 [Hondaea fermentalgiana]|eukprot:GBG32101.1 Hypothetical Protein FCC1311_083262 [Hondaea fermentalgiana]
MNGMQSVQAVQTVCTAGAAVFLLFAPEVATDMIPEMAVPHSAGYRLTGLLLIGLTLIYAAGVVTNDYMLAAATSLGRLTTIPMIIAAIMLLRAPPVLALSVVPDVLLALVAFYFVQKEGAHLIQARGLDSEESKPELLARLFLAFAGGLDMVEGAFMVADPTKYSEYPIIANPYLLKGPKFFGLRIYGCALFIIGGYQLASMASRSPGLIYAACGAYHLIFAAGLYFLAPLIGDPQLGKEINHPLYHVPLGLLVFIFAINIPRSAAVAPPASEHTKKE